MIQKTLLSMIFFGVAGCFLVMSPARAATDLTAIPVSTVPLPAFPYVDWPNGLPEANRNVWKQSDFDELSLIVGDQIKTVEGRLEERYFANLDLHWSKLAARRNYQTAIAALGGQKVNAAVPSDEKFIRANGGDVQAIAKKLDVLATSGTYDSYLLRTADANIWFVVYVDDDGLNTGVNVLREQAMTQSVAPLKAEAMHDAISQQGHVALYINFATDSAVLPADSAATVSEVSRLLQQDKTLKLSVEGHTDSAGSAEHDKILSRQRADAVVRALTAKGIAGDRLAAVGFGQEHPIASNDDDAGRAKNRRVELVKR